MTGTFMVDQARAARRSPKLSMAPPSSAPLAHPTGMGPYAAC
jgi:hypothetical protein